MITESGPLIGAIAAARLFRRAESWEFFGSVLAGALHYIAATALTARLFHAEITTPLWLTALVYVGAIAIAELYTYIEAPSPPQEWRYELGAWLGIVLILGTGLLADPPDDNMFPVGAVLLVSGVLIAAIAGGVNRTTTTLMLEIAGLTVGLLVEPTSPPVAAGVGVGLATVASLATGRVPYWKLKT